MTANPLLLEVRGLCRAFPGVQALDQVDLPLFAGEVHALVGENGAGKSTLIHILTGMLAADSGQILLDNSPIQCATPHDAQRAGIAAVHQEAELFPSLSIAENIAWPRGLPRYSSGLVNWRSIQHQAQHLVAATGQLLDVRHPASELSVAQRHMMQIAAIVQQQARLVILDEPTAALSGQDVEWLYQQIARMTQSGAAILYVSHRQEEIFQLADRITVLRDGRRVWHGPIQNIDRGGLIAAMVGRAMSDVPPLPPLVLAADQPPRLQVIQLADADRQFEDVNLELRAGEIVGLYGLVGAGRSQLAQAVFGLRASVCGMLLVNGTRVNVRSPADAVRAGVAYLPEDRGRQGLFPQSSLRFNLVLSSLRRWTRGMFTSNAKEQDAADKVVSQFAIRCRSLEQSIAELSGGNQQKALLGRCLLAEPAVLLLDEPTRGVDVGARQEIHRHLRALSNQGCAILLISSDLPEVLQCSHRVLVMRQGRLVGDFDPRESIAASQIAAAALPVSDLPTAASTTIAKRRRQIPRGPWALAACVLLLGSFLAWTSPGFRWLDVATNTAQWAILGLAAATVIVAGGIDISVGALLALSAATAAAVVKSFLPLPLSIPLAVMAAMLVGAVGGGLNAWLARVGRIHPLVVTLGTMTIYRGLVITWMQRRAITDIPPAFGWLAVDAGSGFRGALVVAVVTAITVHVVWMWTRLGRSWFAYGSSPRAARQVGIDGRRAWLTAFAVGGALTGLAGALQLAHSQQMQAQLGTGWELQAIAIAVVGGTSITGGRGTVLGVLFGALLLRLLDSALVRWGIAEYQTQLFVGAILLSAVLLDLFSRRRRGLHAQDS